MMKKEVEGERKKWTKSGTEEDGKRTRGWRRVDNGRGNSRSEKVDEKRNRR